MDYCHYKGDSLLKYTNESKKATKERILNEKSQLELNDITSNRRSLKEKLRTFNKKSASLDEFNCTRKPEKYLEAGKKLPKKYNKYFTSELAGIPLEEIDEFYKSDHVRNILKPDF